MTDAVTDSACALSLYLSAYALMYFLDAPAPLGIKIFMLFLAATLLFGAVTLTAIFVSDSFRAWFLKPALKQA